MSAFSKEISDAIINHLLRNVQHTSPTTVYLALHASGGSVAVEPGDVQATAFATELGYTSYARQAITFGAPSGADVATVANDASIVFPAIDTGEGPISVTGYSIWTAVKGVDSASSGVMLFQDAIDIVKEFADADAPLFNVGAVTVTLD